MCGGMVGSTKIYLDPCEEDSSCCQEECASDPKAKFLIVKFDQTTAAFKKDLKLAKTGFVAPNQDANQALAEASK